MKQKKKHKKKKSKKLSFEKNDKPNVIVFCAHPDDQIFGPGGTLVKYAKEGKNVFTYIFSYGESYPMWVKQKVNIETRVRESQEADKVIGGKGVSFFGLKEGSFLADYVEKKLNEKIKKILINKKPEKIFIHSIDDPHPDHKAVFKIVTSLVEVLGLKTEIYCFDVWNPFNIKTRNHPMMYVDISKTFKRKLKALDCFKSQKIPVLLLLWSVYTRSFLHGLKIRSSAAERFVKMK